MSNHPTDKLYPYQPAEEAGPWVLSRDGVGILTGTERECWTWIHSHTPHSVSHALQHEGYTIRAGKVGPIDLRGTREPWPRV
jgi:hypothetical protein